MSTDILISSDPWENRVAILEDGHLAEVYFEREEKVIGSIFKGKVQNVLPGMGASFVDIGLGRNAFLYVDDINKTPLNIGDVEITQGRTGWTINEKVNRGDDVLVQIVKEPRGLKGARISTNISLPGRYLILMPTGRYSGVSRKIESADERNRLKGIMKMIRPEGMATVVRTAAANVSQAELIADLGVLIRMWHGILETYKRAPAPSLIHKDMNLVYKAARDFITPEVDRVLIDNGEEFEKVRDFMRLLGPQYVERIEHYNHGRSLFKDFKVDEEVERLLRPTIKLPSGGSIVIETTEALTVIDVNSGKFTGGKNLEDTIVRTNIEAAAEIARQVRLRDIGGIIVCDFIDMNTETSRTRVIDTLKNGLQKDRTRTTIQSFSALGLLEFTRKRVGKDLAGQLRGQCPTCVGLGTVMSPETVAIDAFRQLRKFGHAHLKDALAGAPTNGHAHNPIEIIAPPQVGAQLEYWYEDELAALEREVDARIGVRVDPTLHPERTRIELAHEPLDTAPGVRVGDEVDVELMHGRLPNPSSALAIVNGRLVEVENAYNAIGQSIKIKVIDIDDEGNVLAEPRGAVSSAAPVGEAKRRRRRGGRGRTKPLTTEEQTEELLELAEEASKGVGGRAVIGISTASEAEAEDAETRAHTSSTPPLAELGAPAGAAPVGERRPSADAPAAAAEPAEGLAYASYGGDSEEVRKRRRRRRRRRPAGAPGTGVAGGADEAVPAADGVASALPAIDAEDDEDAEGESEGEGDEAAGDGTAIAASAGVPGVDGEDPVRRKRRRRRRRGGRGPGLPVDGSVPAGIPERQIFRVGSDGTTEATGEVAPPEPGRAIEAVREAPIAVTAPPPSLSVADVPPRMAKPSRGRRRVDDLVDAAAPAALPPPEPPAQPAVEAAEAVKEVDDVPETPEPPFPKRRGRPRKADATEAPPLDRTPDEMMQPKRRGRPRKADAPVAAPPAEELLAIPDPEPEPEPKPELAPKPRRARAASPAPEPEPEPERPARRSTALKAPAKKAVAKKSRTAAAPPPAARKAPARKTATAAKATAKKKTATTARKKK